MKTKEQEVIAMLIAVARAAHNLCDNTEIDEDERVSLQYSDFNELGAALDALDELPEPGELIVATGPAKAEAFLRREAREEEDLGSFSVLGTLDPEQPEVPVMSSRPDDVTTSRSNTEPQEVFVLYCPKHGTRAQIWGVYRTEEAARAWGVYRTEEASRAGFGDLDAMVVRVPFS